MKRESLIPLVQIEYRIHELRGQKIIVDSDLADLYVVPTKALNQAVKRNLERFPGDLMFHLTRSEKEEVVTNCDHLAKLKFSPVLPPPEPKKRKIGFKGENGGEGKSSKFVNQRMAFGDAILLYAFDCR